MTDAELYAKRQEIEWELLRRMFEKEQASRCPHCGQPMPDEAPTKLTMPRD